MMREQRDRIAWPKRLITSHRIKQLAKGLAWATAVGAICIFIIGPCAMVWFMTRAGTRPMDRRLSDTPATYGASYEDISFQADDGLQLKGWYIPGRGRSACVILCHGRFRSRREVLPQAMELWEEGYSALLFDFRQHGESQSKWSTFGYEERKDVKGAVRYMLAERRYTGSIAVLGVSMGAAAALLAAAETPEIEAVIADSAFRSFRNTVAHHIRSFLRLPAYTITEEILFLMRIMAGVDGTAFDLEMAVRRMNSRPILFIAGGADRRMPPTIAADLWRQSASPRKALLIVPRAGHGHAYQTNPHQYRSAIVDFLGMSLPH
ncbi:MAG: alpha/beta hydrolase [Acidobacteria bacterium]|nr:alpha/beta hydrolase [Acidobacteriota bacterium]MBI3655622.1 alpha/beta hydrolase [Acidobacteriota bacterium]